MVAILVPLFSLYNVSLTFCFFFLSQISIFQNKMYKFSYGTESLTSQPSWKPVLRKLTLAVKVSSISNQCKANWALLAIPLNKLNICQNRMSIKRQVSL